MFLFKRFNQTALGNYKNNDSSIISNNNNNIYRSSGDPNNPEPNNNWKKWFKRFITLLFISSICFIIKYILFFLLDINTFNDLWNKLLEIHNIIYYIMTILIISIIEIIKIIISHDLLGMDDIGNSVDNIYKKSINNLKKPFNNNSSLPNSMTMNSTEEEEEFDQTRKRDEALDSGTIGRPNTPPTEMYPQGYKDFLKPEEKNNAIIEIKNFKAKAIILDDRTPLKEDKFMKDTNRKIPRLDNNWKAVVLTAQKSNIYYEDKNFRGLLAAKESLDGFSQIQRDTPNNDILIVGLKHINDLMRYQPGFRGAYYWNEKRSEIKYLYHEFMHHPINKGMEPEKGRILSASLACPRSAIVPYNSNNESLNFRYSSKNYPSLAYQGDRVDVTMYRSLLAKPELFIEWSPNFGPFNGFVIYTNMGVSFRDRYMIKILDPTNVVIRLNTDGVIPKSVQPWAANLANSLDFARRFECVYQHDGFNSYRSSVDFNDIRAPIFGFSGPGKHHLGPKTISAIKILGAAGFRKDLGIEDELVKSSLKGDFVQANSRNIEILRSLK
jgi:hypothetical protein